MLHFSTTQNINEHYAVGFNEKYVLVQVQEQMLDGTISQSRIPLTIEEIQHMISMLQAGIRLHQEYKRKVDNTLLS